MIAALIQSRIDSKRFPGKALAKIGNKKLIEICINNIKRTKFFTPILITSNRKVDWPLIDIAKDNDILYFQGPLNNVAKRAYSCLNHFEIDYFARINGDCPFLSPKLLDSSFELLLKNNLHLVSNIIERTYPYGISVEVFSANKFRESYFDFVKDKYFCEHYTSYFYKNIDKFRFKSLTLKKKYSDVKLTVDYPEDKNRVEKLLAFDPNIFSAEIETIINTYYKLNI